MRRRIKRFVSNTLNYPIPDSQEQLDWNFTALTPKVSKFPGMSGGFDEYMRGWLPSELGAISLTWKLISSTYAGLRALKEAVRAMAGAGTGRLLVIPEDQIDESRGLRWADVRSINLAMPENAINGANSQDVKATFQAADPVWYGCEPTTDPNEPEYNRDGWWHLDDGLFLDTPGLVFGGPRVTQIGINPTTSITCTNRGSHVTSPVFRFSVGTIDGIIGVRRLDPNSLIVQDAWEWQGWMASHEVLVIDCKKTSVVLETTIGDQNSYFGFYTVTGIGFTELPAGDSLLEIYGSFTGLTIEIEYPDAWY